MLPLDFTPVNFYIRWFWLDTRIDKSTFKQQSSRIVRRIVQHVNDIRTSEPIVAIPLNLKYVLLFTLRQPADYIIYIVYPNIIPPIRLRK